MPFPGTSDYPDSVDTDYGSGAPRVDNVNVVWDDDYNFPDIQIRRLQTYLGVSGDLLGAGVAGKGFGGMVSPVASGGVAVKLAARQAFGAGTILSVGDAYDGVYTEKMRLNYQGLLWALAGADFGSGEFFRLPHGNALPVTFDEARLFHKDDEDAIYVANGAGWSALGGSAGSYLEMGVNFLYEQEAVPVEETVGQGIFDGSIVGSLTPYFRSIYTPTFTGGSPNAEVRLYDMGPAAGPPGVPRLVTTLSTSASGLRADEQVLTVVAAAPGTDDILNSARMYEVTVYQTSVVADTVYLGSAGLDVR